MNGSPCSRNTSVSFRAFFIIRESFPPVISWCCVLLSLLSLPYSAANSCNNLDSSGAMRKNLSSAFSFLRCYSYYSSNHLQCPVFLLNPLVGSYCREPSHTFRHTEVSFHEFCQEVWWLNVNYITQQTLRVVFEQRTECRITSCCQELNRYP